MHGYIKIIYLNTKNLKLPTEKVTDLKDNPGISKYKVLQKQGNLNKKSKQLNTTHNSFYFSNIR